MCIDYGGKRSGIAVTDPLKIIATGLATVETRLLIPYLKEYISKEEVEKILVGDPRKLDDSENEIAVQVNRFIGALDKNFPEVNVERIDERFSSKIASRAMVDMGLKKKKRRDKSIVDEVAATMMLQEYLTK